MTCWSNHRLQPTAMSLHVPSLAARLAVAEPGRSTEFRGVTPEASSS